MLAREVTLFVIHYLTHEPSPLTSEYQRRRGKPAKHFYDRQTADMSIDACCKIHLCEFKAVKLSESVSLFTSFATALLQSDFPH